MKNYKEEGEEIIIRNFLSKDKEDVYYIFRMSNCSVMNYRKLNFKTSKLIFLNLLDKYKGSKYFFLLIILFSIFILKIFAIDLFNYNNLYYYLTAIFTILFAWIIFTYFYLKLLMREFNYYTDHSISTDFKEPEKWVNEPNSNLWVATIKEEVVGSIGIIQYVPDIIKFPTIKTNGNKVAELKRMYVSPKFFRRGIASELYKILEQWCIQNGFDEIILSTSYYQVDAVEFYKNMGFELSELIISDFNKPNFPILAKDLKNNKKEQ